MENIDLIIDRIRQVGNRHDTPFCEACSELQSAVEYLAVEVKRIIEITTADVKREAPAPAKKTKTHDSPSLPAALKVLFAECDQQKDAMVFEIHKDTIAAIRAAVK